MGPGQPSCWGFDSWNDCVRFGECRGLHIDRAASEESVTIFRYRCRHAGEWLAGSGYVPSDEAYGHNTFQVLDTHLKAGCAENGVVNAALELTAESAR